jgi:hypothetical protein
MLTVVQLSSWSKAAWEAGRQMVDDRTAAELTTAAQLDEAAATIEKSWEGAAGGAIASTLRELAKRHREWLPILAEVCNVLTTVATATAGHQADLAVAVKDAQSLGITVNDSGSCSMPDLPFPTSPQAVIDRIKLWYATMQDTRRIRTILVQATGDDLLAATALSRLADVALPSADDGPLDLTDAGIRMQVDTNDQDGYGDCVTLSTLMGIARNSPDFVRRHLSYNAATGTYSVVLYDPKTGLPITVLVDPTKLPVEGSQQAATGDVTFLSVYEQALRQQFGDEYTKGQSIGNPAMAITGKPAESVSVGDLSSVLGTKPPGTIVAGVYNSQMPGTDPSKLLCPGHAYNVVSVDSAGSITLANPWGPQGGFHDNTYYPGRVTLTPDEYKRWVGGTVAVKQPY